MLTCVNKLAVAGNVPHQPTNSEAPKMSTSSDIQLIDELRSERADSQWFAFRESFDGPDQVATLVAALSNSARLANQETAYVVWGVSDKSFDVVGTSFDPQGETVGSRTLQGWLGRVLKPTRECHFRVVDYTGKRLVLLEFPSTLGVPVAFKDMHYVQEEDATLRPAEPDTVTEIMERSLPYIWERLSATSHVEPEFVLDSLDYERYFELINQPTPKSTNRILKRLAKDELIRPSGGGLWEITNLAAVLLANDLNRFGTSLARKEIRFVNYRGMGRAGTVTHYLEESRGYAVGFNDFMRYLNIVLPEPEYLVGARRCSRPFVPRQALREVVLNAMMHQDMSDSGRSLLVEMLDNRIEVTNPGECLVPPEQMLDQPPRTRNPTLAKLMRRMEGYQKPRGGVRRVFAEVEEHQSAPLSMRTELGYTRVTLNGFWPSQRGSASIKPVQRVVPRTQGRTRTRRGVRRAKGTPPK